MLQGKLTLGFSRRKRLGSWAFVRKAHGPTISTLRPAAPQHQRRLVDPACPVYPVAPADGTGVAPADGSGSHFDDTIETNSLQSKIKALALLMIACCSEHSAFIFAFLAMINSHHIRIRMQSLQSYPSLFLPWGGNYQSPLKSPKQADVSAQGLVPPFTAFFHFEYGILPIYAFLPTLHSRYTGRLRPNPADGTHGNSRMPAAEVSSRLQSVPAA